MAIKYYKLLDRMNRAGIGKEELRKKIDVSSTTIAKISKNESVSLEVINKICDVLDCQPGDILEFVREQKPARNARSQETDLGNNCAFQAEGPLEHPEPEDDSIPPRPPEANDIWFYDGEIGAWRGPVDGEISSDNGIQLRYNAAMGMWEVVGGGDLSFS